MANIGNLQESEVQFQGSALWLEPPDQNKYLFDGITTIRPSVEAGTQNERFTLRRKYVSNTNPTIGTMELVFGSFVPSLPVFRRMNEMFRQSTTGTFWIVSPPKVYLTSVAANKVAIASANGEVTFTQGDATKAGFKATEKLADDELFPAGMVMIVSKDVNAAVDGDDHTKSDAYVLVRSVDEANGAFYDVTTGKLPAANVVAAPYALLSQACYVEKFTGKVVQVPRTLDYEATSDTDAMTATYVVQPTQDYGFGDETADWDNRVHPVTVMPAADDLP